MAVNLEISPSSDRELVLARIIDAPPEKLFRAWTEPDTRAETGRLFQALADGGKIEMPLQDMFWGGYFGSLVDRFGIRWMFNCASKV